MKIKFMHLIRASLFLLFAIVFTNSTTHEVQALTPEVATTGNLTVTASLPATSYNIIPLYRLYNPNNGEHLYTPNKAEYDALGPIGWRQESISFYAYNGPAEIDAEVALPWLRVYNPNSGLHHWTTSRGEYNYLGSIGWRQEGSSGYIFAKQVTDTVPLFRLYNPNDGTHHWTLSTGERNFIVSVGWRDEGIAGYVLSSPSGLAAADFEKQVYVSKDEPFVSVFFDDRTGVEYDMGQIGNGNGAPFTWMISDEKLDVAFNSGINSFTYTLKSIDGNKYVGEVNTSGLVPFEATLYRAKPLSIADFDGKILAVDTSNEPECSARTIKITGNSVNLKEICTEDGVTERLELVMTLSAVSGLDNAVELGFTEGGIQTTVMIVLIEGSLATSGTVALVEKEFGVLSGVEITTVTRVNTEAF